MNAWVIYTKALFLLIAALLSGCGNNLCSVEPISKNKSPTGKYIANVFERDCGATTPYVRVVSLQETDSEFNPEEVKNWVFTIQGQSDIHVSWITKNELQISFSFTGDTPTQRSAWKNVTIRYQ
ncbi:hypothetical protein SAMN05428977_1001127 [Nitrosomonas sp. Nm166]|nr:hypothetical protein SAMN05428977_1001127 [Nitrosomonas sp. Nm166]